MSVLLDVKDLKKSFGGLWAVKSYSLELPKGKIYGLIGPNGAGKTTIFNMINNFIKPSGGRISFNEVDITGKKPDFIARLGIARTFQNLRLFRNLNTEINIKIGGHKYLKYGFYDLITNTSRYKKEEEDLNKLVNEIMNLLNLKRYKDSIVGSLPYGIQKRVEIARALVSKPELLLMDEPTAGMNPSEARELEEFVKEVKEEFSLTILIIEHRMPFVMRLAEKIQVLDHGILIAEGIPEEVRTNRKVIKAYLGEVKNLA